MLSLYLMSLFCLVAFAANIPALSSSKSLISGSFSNSRHISHIQTRRRTPIVSASSDNEDENIDWANFYRELERYRRHDANLGSRLSTRHPELDDPEYTVTDKMLDELVTFKWIVDKRNGNEMMFGAFVKDEYIEEINEQILSKIMFYICPAGYQWHEIADDIELFHGELNDIPGRRCIQILSTVGDQPQLAIDASKGMGWLTQMRFTAIDINSHFPAGSEFAHIARTVVAVVKTFNEQEESYETDGLFLTSQTVRTVDTNGVFVTLNLLDLETADPLDFHRIAHVPAPKTFQDAIDILRPLYYDMEGFRKRYSEMMIKLSETDIDADVTNAQEAVQQNARIRIDQALSILENLFLHKDDI